jgi:DNA primase
VPASSETVSVDGQALSIGHGEKVFFSEAGITKRVLIEYYLAVADAALTGCFARPCVHRRYPEGARGSSFFQKRAPAGVNLGCIDINP